MPLVKSKLFNNSKIFKNSSTKENHESLLVLRALELIKALYRRELLT
jgi:hypothetical protein